MDNDAAPSQRKKTSQREKTNRRTKNSEEKTVKRAEKQQRRGKASADEGFDDAVEIKQEVKEGENVQVSADVDGMEIVHEDEETEVSTNLGCKVHGDKAKVEQEGMTEPEQEVVAKVKEGPMTGIAHQFGTATMQDLQFGPKPVAGQASAVPANPTVYKVGEHDRNASCDVDLLKHFRSLKIEPSPKREVGPPSIIHALEMENKDLKARIRDMEKEITQKNELNAELTAITEDLSMELRRRDA